MNESLSKEESSINLTSINKNKLDKNGYYLLPQFLSKEDATNYEIETRSLPIRWVHTAGLTTIRYQSQHIPLDSNLGRLFLCDSILDLICTAMGFPSVQQPEQLLFWIHRYELHQYITEHKDRAGDIQLLISLKQPPKENGGVLFIKNGDNIIPLPMQTGDAALLYASQYFHFSNVLVETEENPSPSKVIAVARYYF